MKNEKKLHHSKFDIRYSAVRCKRIANIECRSWLTVGKLVFDGPFNQGILVCKLHISGCDIRYIAPDAQVQGALLIRAKRGSQNPVYRS
jgi:hypothetical protein